jgi:farnesyl-diphosphate farnesyltransferase
LRVLPRPVRKPIGLAYLLARASDTIADTELIPVEERLDLLGAMRQRVAGETRVQLELDACRAHQGSSAEARLLAQLPALLQELDRLPPEDQKHIREVVQIITSGQELDVQRFGRARVDSIVSLVTAAELDDYTYRVAGCVGEFWTRDGKRFVG